MGENLNSSPALDSQKKNEIQRLAMDLTSRQRNKYLKELELIESGDLLEKVRRLAKRLCGDYDPEDFAFCEPSANEEAALLERTRREDLLKSVLSKTQLDKKTIEEIQNRSQSNFLNWSGNVSGTNPLGSSSALLSGLFNESSSGNVINPAATTVSALVHQPLNMDKTTGSEEEDRLQRDIEREKEFAQLKHAVCYAMSALEKFANSSSVDQPCPTSSGSVFGMNTQTVDPERQGLDRFPTGHGTASHIPTLSTSITTCATITNTQQRAVNPFTTTPSRPDVTYTTRVTGSRPDPCEIIEVVSDNGVRAQIPRWVADSIPGTEGFTRNRFNAQSTRIESEPHAAAHPSQSAALTGTRPRVGFQDTFTTHYFNASGETEMQPSRSLTQGAILGQQPEPFRPAGPPQLTSAPAQEPFLGPTIQSSFQNPSFSQYADNRALAYQHPARSMPDVGKIVRQWNIRFGGKSGTGIEEFLQRVDECRRLAHISDVDLLNAMTELLDGPALNWCRVERYKWTTWQDFCYAARLAYGIDMRLPRRLTMEAYSRVQADEEPVAEYVYNVLYILGKAGQRTDSRGTIELLYDNMRSDIRLRIDINQVRSVDELLFLARQAEAIIEASKMKRVQLPPEQCILPEAAFRPPKKLDKNKNQVSSVSVDSDNGFSTILKSLEMIMDRLPAENKKDNNNNPSKKFNKQKEEPNAAANPTSSVVITEPASPKPRKKKISKPISDKNKDKPSGPTESVLCWKCSWPGYKSPDCPECSKNEKGSA